MGFGVFDDVKLLFIGVCLYFDDISVCDELVNMSVMFNSQFVVQFEVGCDCFLEFNVLGEGCVE